MAIWDQRNTGRNCHDRDWRENPKVIVTINYYNTLTLRFPSKNGFLDLEYPNVDPNHGFLSSVEAEIIMVAVLILFKTQMGL